MTPLRQASYRRRLCFDLESRPSAYWYDGRTTSEITAFGWRWDGDADVSTLVLVEGQRFVAGDGRLLDYREAYQVFSHRLRTADLVYGHNIRRHDLGLVQSGLWRLGLPLMGTLVTSDTCTDLPKRKDMSVSLESLAALHKLSQPKMPMPIPAWEAANRLEAGGVELARQRVASDVLLQAELRTELLRLSLLGAPRVWRP